MSCKKDFDINNNKNYPKLDYYISGFYFKVIDVEKDMTVIYPDPNVKAYFDYQDSFLHTDSGNTEYLIKTSGQKRVINEEDGIINISLFATFTFPKSFPKNEVEVYLIYQNKDGSYTIDVDELKMAKLNGDKCSLYTTFTYEKQKYQLNIVIGLYKE